MITDVPADPAFDLFVQDEVRRAVAKAVDFRALIGTLPGISPTDAVRALKGMNDQPAPRLLASALQDERPQPLPQGAHLPLPHPLDLEWRFSEASAAALLEKVIEASGYDDAVLLLGVPTVAAAAIDSDARRSFHVIGEDNVVCRSLIEASTRDPRFVHDAASDEPVRAALVDPPWYFDSYAEMVGLCSARCAPGATLFLVLPPVGIRPSAGVDREKMLEIARRAGFDLAETGAEPLSYRSPLFELAAFRAAGIGAWLPDWRTGDLVRLTKTRELTHAAPQASRPAAFELTLDGTRMKLLLDRPGPAMLEPLVPGGVVPSVSVRYPERARASLWTSTNRAFAVDSARAFDAMLALAAQRGLVLRNGLIGGNSTPDARGNIDEIQRLTHLFERLADEERAAAVELVGEAAWLNINDARFLPGRSQDFPKARHGAAA
jgi:hypothetical protein